MEDILSVLKFVHKEGVIHRDIKPANLIQRTGDGKIVLIDFGAVKEITTQINNTTTQIGTPGYMSPEQEKCAPKFSSDIYALGMTGIQFLTGRLPQELLRGSEGVIWKTPDFLKILDRMVRYNHEQRYSSAAEALADFDCLRNSQPLKSLTSSTPTGKTTVPNPDPQQSNRT